MQQGKPATRDEEAVEIERECVKERSLPGLRPWIAFGGASVGIHSQVEK